MTKIKLTPADVSLLKDNTLKSPRIHFNWGYHDAAAEVRMRMPRIVVAKGQPTRSQVSREYDKFYAAGYEYGLRDAKAGTSTHSSEPAWLECTS